MVSVAVVNGAAVGGGAELSTACDYRVLSSDAKIQFVQVKVSHQLLYLKQLLHENRTQAGDEALLLCIVRSLVLLL
jgi:enoyl-CoA hydratase/carnithine racemase